MPVPRWGAWVAFVFAAGVLASALVLPWYAFGASSSAGKDTQLFYLGLPSENHTVRYACSSGFPCHSDTSYTTQGYGSIGTIAETGFSVVIAALVVAVAAVVATLRGINRGRRLALPGLLGVTACALAVASPLLYLLGLPGAESKDMPAADRPTSSGPWSSFVGSTSFNEPHLGTLSLSWGPAVGWYFAIAAALLVVVGLVLRKLERPTPGPAPSDVSSAS